MLIYIFLNILQNKGCLGNINSGSSVPDKPVDETGFSVFIFEEPQPNVVYNQIWPD